MKLGNTFENINKRNKIVIVIALIVTILSVTLPMGLCPIWNGEIPEHRNQYEIMADSILKGHLYLDYGEEVDRRLMEMDNPYDPQARDELGVYYHWDHAFYKGNFYMYFGIAPVFLTFIPYKLITGQTLVTYKATQFFAALFIAGVFALFYFICNKMYRKTRISTYMLGSMALSALSIWVAICQPALYCTAIVSGLCMAIWSIYFFFKAVYSDCTENKSILYVLLGSIFGALTFACRPPIGFVNFLAIPLLVKYLKKHKVTKNLIIKLILAVLPYVIIGSLLMIYNYRRFDSPFEFGQTYQLTMEDQSQYSNILTRLNYGKLVDGLKKNFFNVGSTMNRFPFVGLNGIFFNFPILFLPILFIFNDKFRKEIKKKDLNGFYLLLMIMPIIVTIVDIIYSPGVGERYMMDEYYLMIISTFISIVTWYSIIDKEKHKKFTKFINIFLVLMILKTVLLFCVPHDSNYAQYYPNAISDFVSTVTFGLVK